MKPVNHHQREPLNRSVDLPLLLKQVETLGGVQLGMKTGSRKEQHLQGLFNMLHDIIDDLEVGKESILQDGKY